MAVVESQNINFRPKNLSFFAYEIKTRPKTEKTLDKN